jgi:hypothetical protein
VDPTLRITLNFHPDRLVGGLPILEVLARDGAYVSQFVTGTSNGGLTAHPGGDRWRWESRIFGAAYDSEPPHERPVYGALNFRRQRVGAAPRFGSSHFRLTGAALRRATFCYPDSAAEPSAFGVAAGMSLIEMAEADEQDALNDYIEAQVHGPVCLARDMEALVLDASYRGTGGRADFDTAARRRLALYRSYLYLIMLIETVPRAVGDDDVVRIRTMVAPQLVAALDDIGRHGARTSKG